MSVLLPASLIFLALLIIPLGIAFLLQTVIPMTDTVTIMMMYRYIYPSSLLILLMVVLWKTFAGSIKHWMEQIRDDQYLVGRKLHNVADSVPSSSVSSASTRMTSGESSSATVVLDG